MNKDVFSIISVLEQKNSYLLEFHRINTDELRRLSEGCADNLENFYYSRELLLDAIKKLDDQISSNKLNKNLFIHVSYKNKLLDILNLKRKMVKSILNQDLAIISLVNQIKKRNKKNIAS